MKLGRQERIFLATRGNAVSRTSAFTMVEIVFVVGVLAFLALLFVQGIRWLKDASSVGRKTEIIAKCKNASAIIGKELSCAADFLYPNAPSSNPSPILVFKNLNNEVSVLFLDSTGLQLYNYNTGNVRMLFRMATCFEARLVQNNLMEYLIGFTEEGYDFSVRNRLTTFNSLP